MKSFVFWLLASLLITPASYAQEAGYPGRTTYPTVKVMETEQLNNSFNNVVVIDVRSRYEFDTLHINQAFNVQLESPDFVQRIQQLGGDGKALVFYCNGHTCYKSYKAAIKAQDGGNNKVFAYDSGIFDWAKAHPEKSTLLGQSPLDPALLIGKDKLEAHMLPPTEFNAKIDAKTVILDIREPRQRGLIELYPYRQENISLDERRKMDRFLNGIKADGKTLLVYDEAGKQVRWFQYYLQEKGITDYHFMQGGTKGFFKALKK